MASFPDREGMTAAKERRLFGREMLVLFWGGGEVQMQWMLGDIIQIDCIDVLWAVGIVLILPRCDVLLSLMNYLSE